VKTLANKEKDEDKKDDTQKQASINKTPPAPPEKTKAANFAESSEGFTIFVQAESASDDKKE
jgi:hypothetical protein